MEVTNHTSQNRHITLVKGLTKEESFKEIALALATAPPASTRQLWIDCSHVDRDELSNNSLRSFVNELLKIKKEKVLVVLCGMDKTTERLFILLKLDMLFVKARTLDEVYRPAHPEVVAA